MACAKSIKGFAHPHLELNSLSDQNEQGSGHKNIMATVVVPHLCSCICPSDVTTRISAPSDVQACMTQGFLVLCSLWNHFFNVNFEHVCFAKFASIFFQGVFTNFENFTLACICIVFPSTPSILCRFAAADVINELSCVNAKTRGRQNS